MKMPSEKGLTSRMPQFNSALAHQQNKPESHIGAMAPKGVLGTTEQDQRSINDTIPTIAFAGAQPSGNWVAEGGRWVPADEKTAEDWKPWPVELVDREELRRRYPRKVRVFEGEVLRPGHDYAFWLDDHRTDKYIGLSDFFEGLGRKHVRVTVEVLDDPAGSLDRVEGERS